MTIAGIFSQVQPIALLVLGWILGLLSPSLQERIRRGRRRRELVEAINSELREHQWRLALVAYSMRMKVADLPDEFIVWLVKTTENYRGIEYNPKIQNFLSGLVNTSRKDREAAAKSLDNPEKGKSLKEYRLPLVEAHWPELATFSVSTEAALLQVVTHTDFYNQHVRFLQSQFDKTFSCSDHQREVIVGNLNSGYLELAGIAQRIADAVDKFLIR